jgi:hypothetical protein
MIPLSLAPTIEKPWPQFPLWRVKVDVWLEPADPNVMPFMTRWAGAIVDIGAPYSILPHRFHHQGLVHIRQDFGYRPFRILAKQAPVMQRFVEVGIRFLVTKPQMAYQPDQFLPIKAYLLDAGQRPTGVFVLGLDALREHFRTHIEEGNSFLQLRS